MTKHRGKPAPHWLIMPLRKLEADVPPVYLPPAPVPWDRLGGASAVFLAGSIEMGAAEDWQTVATEAFVAAGVAVLNPRRTDWDASWKQEADFAPFREQVEWELSALEGATAILLYLSPGTKSPISLLELGLYARSGKLVVACPEGFWRRGNVQIVCERYGVPCFDSLKDALGNLAPPDG